MMWYTVSEFDGYSYESWNTDHEYSRLVLVNNYLHSRPCHRDGRILSYEHDCVAEYEVCMFSSALVK